MKILDYLHSLLLSIHTLRQLQKNSLNNESRLKLDEMFNGFKILITSTYGYYVADYYLFLSELRAI